jgi:hypothetical protein
MGWLYPFRITSQERKEIRDCARIYFYGGNPAAQEETEEAWLKWKKVFEVFLICRDARYGNLLHLPFSGGVYEQPAKTMDAIEQIQACYYEKLKDDMDSAMSSLH